MSIFIPSGDISFHGNREDLARSISALGGTLETSIFSCTKRPPYSHMRSPLDFRFAGSIQDAGESLTVRYQVLPGPVSLLLLIILLFSLAAGIISAIFHQGSWLFTGLAFLVFLSFLAALVLQRKDAMERFEAELRRKE